MNSEIEENEELHLLLDNLQQMIFIESKTLVPHSELKNYIFHDIVRHCGPVTVTVTPKKDTSDDLQINPT